MERKRIYITVKAYPTLSEKHDELVCTAGICEDGSWIRLYPLPFRKLKSCLCIRDSMIQEHINDGDIVIFNTKLTEKNGIFVVSFGSILVVKRVDFDTSNHVIILISASTAYEHRRLSGYELDNIKVAGRVVAYCHRL